MKCAICTKPLESIRDAYCEVKGWERPGRGINDRSGSSLVLREKTGAFAHADCVARTQHQVSVRQEVLL